MVLRAVQGSAGTDTQQRWREAAVQAKVVPTERVRRTEEDKGVGGVQAGEAQEAVMGAERAVSVEGRAMHARRGAMRADVAMSRPTTRQGIAMAWVKNEVAPESVSLAALCAVVVADYNNTAGIIEVLRLVAAKASRAICGGRLHVFVYRKGSGMVSGDEQAGSCADKQLAGWGIQVGSPGTVTVTMSCETRTNVGRDMETYTSFVQRRYDKLPTNLIFTPSTLDVHGRRSRLAHLLEYYGEMRQDRNGTSTHSFGFDCASTNTWLRVGDESYSSRSFHRSSNFLSEEWQWSLAQHCAPPADLRGNDFPEDYNKQPCHAVPLIHASPRPFGTWMAAHIVGDTKREHRVNGKLAEGGREEEGPASEDEAFLAIRDVPTCFNGLLRTSSQLLRNAHRPRRFYARIQQLLSVGNNCETVHYVERSAGVVFGGMRSGSRQAREASERAVSRSKERIEGRRKWVNADHDGKCRVEDAMVIGDGYFSVFAVLSVQHCIRYCLRAQDRTPTASGDVNDCVAFTFAAAADREAVPGSESKRSALGGICFLKARRHAISADTGRVIQVQREGRVSGICGM
jgi:hypothetical protein